MLEIRVGEIGGQAAGAVRQVRTGHATDRRYIHHDAAAEIFAVAIGAAACDREVLAARDGVCAARNRERGFVDLPMVRSASSLFA